MKKRLHDLTGLMEVGADLLERLDDVRGIRAGFHVFQEGGVRLLVKNDKPYSDEVGPIDRIALAVGGQVEHTRSEMGGYAKATGSWRGFAVESGHLYFDQPSPNLNRPCVDTAAKVGGRVKAMLPWSRLEWTRFVESVHFYDENGVPFIHVVLLGEDSLEGPRDELLNATGLLSHASSSKETEAEYGSVLMDDGTVLTISSISR